MKSNSIIHNLRQRLKKAQESHASTEDIKLLQNRINTAKAVKCVSVYDVFDDVELDYILHVIKPQFGECFKNAHLLCVAFPDRVQYCEGACAVPYEVDHAFNKVGDSYVDITYELAIGDDVTKFSYASFVELEADEIEAQAEQNGFFGGYIYR